MENLQKKSIWRPGKIKVNLDQKVKTLEEINYLRITRYPLVLALSQEDQEAFRKKTLIFMEQFFSYYKEFESPSTPSTVSYLSLDFDQLEQSFFDGTIYLDTIKTLDGRERFIQSVLHSSDQLSTRIGMVSKRKLFLNESEIEFVFLEALAHEAIDDYQKECRKRRLLSLQEIDEIHKRGHLTPLEKAQEWGSLGLCAPGDYGGSAKKRCRQFKSCSECLLDYAYGQDEYTSTFDHLKVVNAYAGDIKEDLGQNEEAVKKIGAKHD